MNCRIWRDLGTNEIQQQMLGSPTAIFFKIKINAYKNSKIKCKTKKMKIIQNRHG